MYCISEILSFADTYRDVNPDRILLGKNLIPHELRKAVALQVELRRKLQHKLPSWADSHVYIPSKLALEQSSSMTIAKYKTRFVGEKDVVADLTGGLGVDLYYLSRATSETCYYCEKQEQLAEAAKFNYNLLCQDRIPHVFCGDSLSMLDDLISKGVSLIYVDPARRAGIAGGKEYERKYAIRDCQPDVCKLIPLLPQNGSVRLLIKLSPMLDIKDTLLSVGVASEMHIISQKGELKELLLYCDMSKEISLEQIPITVADLATENQFIFTLGEEQNAQYQLAEHIAQYLYIPNAGIMKSGGFKSLAIRLGLQILHPNTHIFTSNCLCDKFPGRVLKVHEIIPFHNKNLKALKSSVKAANVFCRNFKLTTNQLRDKLKMKEAETPYVIGLKAMGDEQFIVVANPV